MTMPDLTCHEDDEGKIIDLKAGQKIAIDLKENPTTGYKWAEPQYNEKILGFEASEFQPAKDAKVGGGGFRHFVFVAKAPGETHISMVNKRPWESQEAAAAKFTITIRIMK
jgi:inhibitor of cysteine peptidase